MVGETQFDAYFISGGGYAPEILYHYDDAYFQVVREHSSFSEALTQLDSPQTEVLRDVVGNYFIRVLANPRHRLDEGVPTRPGYFPIDIDLPAEGPMTYENWRAYLAGTLGEYASEYALHTDAHITSEVTDGLGPFKLLNARAFGEGTLQPAIGLQLEHHLVGQRLPSLSETNVDRYHGGTQQDEIAALVSLCLGVRLKVGGMTREFSTGADPRGRPWAYNHEPDPILIRHGSRSVLS